MISSRLGSGTGSPRVLPCNLIGGRSHHDRSAELLCRARGASSFQGRTGATIPPVHLPPVGAPPGKLEVVQDPGSIRFTLNGVLRWLVDVHRFAGTPALTHESTPQGTRIVLKGAQLPGTELPADFVLLVQPTGPFGTPAEITFTLGGFRAQVILESWLAGSQVMQSTITLGTQRR